jgi:hypothetical protein
MAPYWPVLVQIAVFGRLAFTCIILVSTPSLDVTKEVALLNATIALIEQRRRGSSASPTSCFIIWILPVVAVPTEHHHLRHTICNIDDLDPGNYPD